VEEGSGFLNCIWSRPKDGWTVIPWWRSEDRNTTKLPTGTPGIGLAPRAISRCSGLTCTGAGETRAPSPQAMRLGNPSSH
jgi:hypothetical protein